MIIALYILGYLAIGAIWAFGYYLIKHVVWEESNYIAEAMACITIAWIIVVPIFMAVFLSGALVMWVIACFEWVVKKLDNIFKKK